MRHAVHVCLVSHEPTPNLTPIFDPDVAPAEVVLVTTPAMAARAGWLEAVLAPRGVRVHRWPVADAYDLEGLQEAMLRLLVARDGDDLALNVTGGTKPMSIAAYEAFRAMDRPIFYVEPTRDRLIWLFHPVDRPPARALADRIRLAPFLAAHGVTVRGAGPSAGVPTERRALCDALVGGMERLGRALAKVNWLAGSAERTLRSEPIERADTAFWEVVDRFRAADVVDVDRGRLVFPDEDARFFVNGGWFEAFVYGLVFGLRRDRPTVQDVARGVQVVGGDDVRNELDVAFLADNRLHVVECKTRRFDRDPHAGSAALYKLETLADVLGGAQAEAMLVSYRPLKDAERRRADAYRVRVVAGRDVARLRDHLLEWIPTR